MMIQFFLLGSALLILYSRLGLGTASAFLLTVIVLNPITMVLTFQEADVYIITLLAVITLFFLNKKKKDFLQNQYCSMEIFSCIISFSIFIWRIMLYEL